MVAESKRWFVGLVASRRNIDPGAVPGLEQGRVFSGREALTHKLIDEVGGEPEAVKYLEEKRNLPKDLKVIDWKPKRDSPWGLVSLSMRALGSLLGDRVAGEIAHVFDSGRAFGSLRLDGLVSVWQGSEK
jgi:protease-4